MKTQINDKTYWTDAKGNLTPEDLIKPIDKARDELVQEWFTKAIELNAHMQDFKAHIFADIQAFIELSAEKYGAKVGGGKGNITFYSFDGKYKIQRCFNDHLQFDERIYAAKALIDQCLHDWTQHSSSEIKAIVNEAFKVDKQGKLSIANVLRLRKVDIQDPRWLDAMQAIQDSLQVVYSKAYVRFYQRKDGTDQYEPICLDMAGV